MSDSSAFSYPLLDAAAKRKRKKETALVLPALGETPPPHSTEAEEAVLGAIMLDKMALSKVADILDKECFYHEKNSRIFTAMTQMFERNLTVDVVSLAEELRRLGELDNVGGVYYLAELNSKTPTAANVIQHARIVQEHFLKRSLISTAMQIVGNCYDDTSDALDEIDKAESAIFEVAERLLRRNYVSMKKAVTQTMEMIIRLSQNGSEHGITGIATGYTKLDDMLGGFQRSDFIIIAARPSMGKTAFAMSIARNVAVDYKMPVAVFSIEMASQQLIIRLLSAESQVNAQDIRTGRLQQPQMKKLIQDVDVLSNAPLFIDDSPSLSVMEFRAKTRRLRHEQKIEMIIVDYLQIMTGPKSESREREISQISRSLKQVAKELNVPVVALAQLNRGVEARSDKRPMLSDLRESGSIEQDADVVMMINRPEYYDITTYEDGTPTEGTAEIIIAKQRNGPVGTVRLAYRKEFARFENLAFQHEDPPVYIPSGAANDFEAAPF